MAVSTSRNSRRRKQQSRCAEQLLSTIACSHVASGQALAEFHGDQVQAEIQEMVPAEWDIFRENKTRVTVHRFWDPLRRLRCRLGARRSPAHQDSQDLPTGVERCRGREDMLHRGLGCIHELGQRQCAHTSVILHVVFKLNACSRSLDTSIPPQMLSTTCEAARTIMLTNERAGYASPKPGSS